MASASIQDVRRRIKSVNSIEHITNAMKLVSAAKLRRAKNAFERTREILRVVEEAIADAAARMVEEQSAEAGAVSLDFGAGPRANAAGADAPKRSCFVVITSNRGLAGSFNANVIKEAERLAKEKAEPAVFACIGSKGRDYFSKRGYEVFSEWTGAPETIEFEQVQEIIGEALEKYKAGEISEIVLVTTSFVTTLEQRATARRLLPFESAAIGAKTASKGIDEEAKAAADTKVLIKEEKIGRTRSHITEYEPNAKEVLAYLVPKYAEAAIYGAVIESAACEHAARRTAMENATDNARQMIADLGLFYNRARQAAITKEITEIVGGADAVSG